MGSIKKIDGKVHVVFDVEELADLGFYHKEPDGTIKWADKMSTALYVAAMGKIKNHAPHFHTVFSSLKIDGDGTITVILEE